MTRHSPPFMHTSSLFLRLSLLFERLAICAFVLLAFLFPFERMEPVIVLAGLEKITTVELPMRAGAALWLLSLLAAWRRPRIPPRLALPALLWLGLMAASAWAAPAYGAEAARFTLRMALALLTGWAVYDLILVEPNGTWSPIRRWRWLAQAMALAGMAVAVIGLLEASQYAFILDWLRPFKGAPTRVGDILRVSSTLPYATIAAMVLEMTLPLVLAWALTARRRWMQAVLALGLLAGLTALALTLTRAGVLALLIALALMAGLCWRWASGAAPEYSAGMRRAALGSLAAAGALAGLVGLILVYNPTAGLRLRTETEQSWYQATYRVPDQLTLSAAAVTSAPVVVLNTSVRDWEAGGATPFQLSYHLLDEDGRQVQYDGPRSSLPGLVRKGEQIEVQAFLQAPAQPGEYIVEWDMVQEGVAWFSWKGATPARTRLVVVAGDAAPVPLPVSPSAPAQVLRIPPPGRLTLWRAALRMAADHPVSGVGPDNFRLVYGPYAGVKTWDPNVHANNLYLEWLAGTGVLGLLVFLWLNGLVLWQSWQGVRGAGGRRRVASGEWQVASGERQVASGEWRVAGGERQVDRVIWGLAVYVGLVAWFVHGLFDSFYEFTPTYTAFWLLAALGMTVGALSSD